MYYFYNRVKLSSDNERLFLDQLFHFEIDIFTSSWWNDAANCGRIVITMDETISWLSERVRDVNSVRDVD